MEAFRQLEDFLALQSTDDETIVNLRAIIPDANAVFPGKVGMIYKENDGSLKDVDNIADMVALAILSVREQGLGLPAHTWRRAKKLYDKVLEFELDPRPENRSETAGRLGLEILLLFSKLDAGDLFDCYYLRSDDKADRFDRYLSFFLNDMLRIVEEQREGRICIEEDIGLKNRIKSFLRKGPVINAAKALMEEASPDTKYPLETFIEIVSWMKIYVSKSGCGRIRGCVLRDGIIIFKRALFSAEGSPGYLADVLTLGANLFGQYVVRKLARDFELRDPVDDGNAAGAAVGGADPRRGAGRFMELKLFNGSQPDWCVTDIEVAHGFVKSATGVDRGGDLSFDGKVLPRRQKTLPFGGDLIYMDVY